LDLPQKLTKTNSYPTSSTLVGTTRTEPTVTTAQTHTHLKLQQTRTHTHTLSVES